MNRHLGMLCETCNEVLSVHDGTDMTEPNVQILSDAELRACAEFIAEHHGHRGVALCLFDVKELAQA